MAGVDIGMSLDFEGVYANDTGMIIAVMNSTK